MGDDAAPRAVVLLVQGDRHVRLGGVDRDGRCDLGLVDDLLRLRLLAKQLGWDVRIAEVRSDLRELFEMVGLADQLD